MTFSAGWVRLNRPSADRSDALYSEFSYLARFVAERGLVLTYRSASKRWRWPLKVILCSNVSHELRTPLALIGCMRKPSDLWLSRAEQKDI